MTVALEVIRFARLRMPVGYAFRPAGRSPLRFATALRAGDDALDAPCVAFVLRHPSEGTILVDTGLHPDALRGLADFGFPVRLLFRGMQPTGGPFDEQLRERGVDPEAVERVLMTHLHADHTSAMRLLPRARFTITRQEWAAAGGARAALRGYSAAHLPATERVDTIDLVADGEPHGPLERTVDLLGDGSIRLVWSPGHTPGHLSILVQTEALGEVLLVGDAAYTRRSIAEERLPLLADDDAAARASLRELHAYAEWAPQTRLVPSHDPDAWRELPGA